MLLRTRIVLSALLFLSAAVPLAIGAPAPDGGPWAPALYDNNSLEARPRQIEAGSPVTVRFNMREGHEHRILYLGLQVRPSAFVIDATEGLNRTTGRFEYTIPGDRFRVEGTYELRLPMRFKWTDGKVYSRTPPLGKIQVGEPADRQYAAGEFDQHALGAHKAINATEQLLDQQGLLQRLQPLLDDLATRVTRARATVAEGDHGNARALLEGVVRDASAIQGDWPAAEYCLNVRRYLARHPPDPEPKLTLMSGSWSAMSEGDIARIRALGCNTVLHGKTEDFPKLKAAGFEVALARAPVRFTEVYAQSHPDERQQRYLLSDEVVATRAVLEMDPLAAFSREHYELDTTHEPKRFWRVHDRTADRTLTPAEWKFDAKAERIVLASAVPDHRYQAAVLVYCAATPFFGAFADPIHPACLRFILRKVDSYIARSGGLDLYRPTSLFYPFPLIEKRVSPSGQMRKWHNWYGYQWGACPKAQALFEKQAGVPFDPAWMTGRGAYCDVNYPPHKHYLKWMRFQQDNVKRFTKQVVEVAHRRGARVRVFWGDHWIGMEPYLEFFEATGMDQIVKACGSDVVLRMTVDVPGPCEKVIRFSPWLDWGELFRHADPAGRMDRSWRRIRRGALFRMPDGLTWGGQTQTVALKDGAIAAKMKQITDEFRLLYSLLGGQEVFRHDLTLYVINAWGRLRAWPGWAGVNTSQSILTHLTDLPVRVKFISIKTLAERGVPREATVLLNAGEPGTAWSGGDWWDDGRAAEAIAAFVRQGGGLIGVGAPSHGSQSEVGWRLRDVLGLGYAGPRSRAAERGSFNSYDSLFLGKGPRAKWTASMHRTSERHWITAGLKSPTEPVLANVRVRLLAPDARLLASGDGKTWASPVLVSREVGQGRAVYINGYSAVSDYGELLRRAVFWAGRREAAWAKLGAEDAGVLTYLYPKRRLLAVYNFAGPSAPIGLRLDPALLGFPLDRTYRITDVLTDRTLAETDGAALRDSFRLNVGLGTVGFIRIDAGD